MTDVSSAAIRLASGKDIPRVGLGVWQVSGGQTLDAVRTAIGCGYRHVDTARIYGNESDVGRALREVSIPRSEVFVTTKLWNSDQGFDQALKAFDASLARLGLEYVDLYLLHWPVARLRLDSWRARERLHDEGRARSIGVSNFLLNHLQELLGKARVAPHVNQLELTPFLQRRDSVKFCRENQIVLEAYSPLTRGQQLKHPEVVAIARELRRSPAQVLLRWGIQQNFVVLPKSVTPSRIRENANLFDFELDREQVTRLDALEEGLVTGWDPADQA
jgi:diketogulonate reductase-like aldo/keto reductase